MSEFCQWADVPRSAAIYAMYGGLAPRTWVAYVGEASNLNSRLVQHLDSRNSSVATGTSAVGLNVDHVAYVAWWLHPLFEDKITRHAGELVAFEVLNPALRSRGGVSQAATELLTKDTGLHADLRTLFSGDPAGRYRPPSLANLAARVERLEARLADLADREH